MSRSLCLLAVGCFVTAAVTANHRQNYYFTKLALAPLCGALHRFHKATTVLSTTQYIDHAADSCTRFEKFCFS